MQWILPLVFGLAILIYILIKRASQITAQEARALLAQGAMVIDVRTPGEFVSGHLRTADNLPLNEIEFLITRRVQDKNRPLLLHCHSGIRSGIAIKKLKALGYTNVHNLGSYGRAVAIVNEG